MDLVALIKQGDNVPDSVCPCVYNQGALTDNPGDAVDQLLIKQGKKGVLKYRLGFYTNTKRFPYISVCY